MAMQAFGRLDSLIRAYKLPFRVCRPANPDGPAVNAGQMGPLGPVASFTDPAAQQALRSLFDVNFFSLVSIISHALPYLRSRDGKEGLKEDEPAGRIVLVSSGAATGGVTGWAAYK